MAKGCLSRESDQNDQCLSRSGGCNCRRWCGNKPPYPSMCGWCVVIIFERGVSCILGCYRLSGRYCWRRGRWWRWTGSWTPGQPEWPICRSSLRRKRFAFHAINCEAWSHHRWQWIIQWPCKASKYNIRRYLCKALFGCVMQLQFSHHQSFKYRTICNKFFWIDQFAFRNACCTDPTDEQCQKAGNH